MGVVSLKGLAASAAFLMAVLRCLFVSMLFTVPSWSALNTLLVLVLRATRVRFGLASLSPDAMFSASRFMMS